MSASTIIAQAFGESALEDLYSDVLKVSSKATSSQLRKAYHKRALVYHPDKQKSQDAKHVEDAKLKFQAVSAAYEILSDEERRREYDENGELLDSDDNLSDSGFHQWDSYFKSIFGPITLRDIDNFETQYKGSDEERRDVLKYYEIAKGDLNQMVSCVMLSTDDDKERWVNDFIKPAITAKEIPYYDALDDTLGTNPTMDGDNLVDSDLEEDDLDSCDDAKQSKKGKKKTSNAKKSKPSKKKKLSKKEREAIEAEELIAKIRGKNGNTGDSQVSQNRSNLFGSMISNMEKRYGGNGGKKRKGEKKRKKQDDISDEEFEKIQANLLRKKT